MCRCFKTFCAQGREAVQAHAETYCGLVEVKDRKSNTRQDIAVSDVVEHLRHLD